MNRVDLLRDFGATLTSEPLERLLEELYWPLRGMMRYLDSALAS